MQNELQINQGSNWNWWVNKCICRTSECAHHAVLFRSIAHHCHVKIHIQVQ